MMNCVSFEMRLDELLDERLPPDSNPDLNDHAENCPHCAQLLADHQALLEAIGVLVRPQAPGDLAARILSEMTREPVLAVSVLHHAEVAPQADHARRSLLQAAVWIAATVAAALLIGVGVVGWNRIHQAVPSVESASPNVDSASNVGSDSVASANPAANRPNAYQGLLAVQSVAEVQSLTTSLISPQQRSLMEQMSDGLKPVTHSMSAALNALRRTLPGSETPARSS